MGYWRKTYGRDWKTSTTSFECLAMESLWARFLRRIKAWTEWWFWCRACCFKRSNYVNLVLPFQVRFVSASSLDSSDWCFLSVWWLTSFPGMLAAELEWQRSVSRTLSKADDTSWVATWQTPGLLTLSPERFAHVKDSTMMPCARFGDEHVKVGISSNFIVA